MHDLYINFLFSKMAEFLKGIQENEKKELCSEESEIAMNLKGIEKHAKLYP